MMIKPTCKALLKVIDLVRETERLYRDVYDTVMTQERECVERSPFDFVRVVESLYARRRPCNLERRLNNNYNKLKFLIKDCGKCKELVTCNIVDYVKKDTIVESMKEELYGKPTT